MIPRMLQAAKYKLQATGFKLQANGRKPLAVSRKGWRTELLGSACHGTKSPVLSERKVPARTHDFEALPNTRASFSTPEGLRWHSPATSVPGRADGQF